MQWSNYFFSNPIVIIILSLFFCGIVAAMIGKYKKQPILVCFVLGAMLGPIGCLIVIFNKSKEITEDTREKIISLLNNDTTALTLNKDEIRNFVAVLKYHIKTLKTGRIIVFISFPLFLFSSISLKYFNKTRFLPIFAITGIITIPIFGIAYFLTYSAGARLYYYTKKHNQVSFALSQFMFGDWFMYVLMESGYRELVKDASILIEKLEERI